MIPEFVGFALFGHKSDSDAFDAFALNLVPVDARHSSAALNASLIQNTEFESRLHCLQYVECRVTSMTIWPNVGDCVPNVPML